MTTEPSADNLDPTLYCAYFGGPRDGFKTGDLPASMSGQKLTRTVSKVPLSQPAQFSLFAVYRCTSETQIGGFWEFHYQGMEGPNGERLVAADAPEQSVTMSDRHAVDQVARASAVASIAHRGATDKLGVPYIRHPEAVAAQFDLDTEWLETSAAWLHDVIEDTDITVDDLLTAGIDPAVIEVVTLLTRRDDVSSDDYYAAIREHPSARRVKLADISHNTDPERVAQLDDAVRTKLRVKYDNARAALR